MKVVGRFFIPSLLVLSVLCPNSYATPLGAAFDKPANRVPAGVADEGFPLLVAPVPDSGAIQFPTPQLVYLPVLTESAEVVSGAKCFIPDHAMLNVMAFSSSNRVRGRLLWTNNSSAKSSKRCLYRRLPNEKNVCAEGGAPTIDPCANGTIILVDFSHVVDNSGAKVDPQKFTAIIQQALMR